MQPGRASQTAVLVAMARAAAHGTAEAEAARFSDPTAMALLPHDARARVEHDRAAPPPRGLREGWARGSSEARQRMMIVRTVVVDDAIRAAAAPQVVILGAGLDGRAWRMPELRDVVVFEVDHPDSQADKRARVAALPPGARDIRFVAVDFARDSLDAALAAAGHDGTRPTTWIWEGVVMYLDRAAIEATLAVIARRSPAGSRLVVVYHSPALMLKLVGWLVRRLGEPLRSAFTAPQMRALLAGHGFGVVSDLDLPSAAAAIAPALVKQLRLLRHMRTVVAARVPV